MPWGGITLADLAQSRTDQGIFALGVRRCVDACSVILRLLNRRCSSLNGGTTTAVRVLSLEKMEAFAEALLEFTALDNLKAWLAPNT